MRRSGSCSASRCSSRSSRADAAATTRTGWCSATRCERGRRNARSVSCSWPTTRSCVRSTRPIRLECVVRGYLFGAGWSEYKERGTIGGFAVPAGLQQAEQLPAPLFTPTTKAESGHDLPLTASEAADLVGADVYERVRDLSIRIYEMGAARAYENGLVLADTKFEFGELDDEIIVIDEMMTPDSSRYWPLDAYRVGTSPP